MIEWVERDLKVTKGCVDGAFLTDPCESHQFFVFVSMWIPVPHLQLPVWLASKRYNNLFFFWTEGRGHNLSGLELTVLAGTQLWHFLSFFLVDHVDDLESALLALQPSLTNTEPLAIL